AENEAHLRRTLLESLARRAEYNLSHMQGNVRLYEIGSAFAPGDPLPDETVRVALLLMGERDPVHFAGPASRAYGALDAKGLEQIELFDLYEGAGVDAGYRSVAWRLTLRHPERTLRDKEIEGRRSKILAALQQELNVRQRTS